MGREGRDLSPISQLLKVPKRKSNLPAVEPVYFIDAYGKSNSPNFLTIINDAMVTLLTFMM